MVQLHYLVFSPVLFYICGYLYVWPISADLGEEKAFPSNFSVVWLEHTLSCCCTSIRNKSRAFTKQNIPLYLLFLMNICGQVYLIIKYFLSCRSSNPKQYKQHMILPSYFSDILAFGATFSVYPTYEKPKQGRQTSDRYSAPLVGLVLKVISRIFVQRLVEIYTSGIFVCVTSAGIF